MSANGNNVVDMFFWLQRVLQSCENFEQQESAKRLVMLYAQKLVRQKKYHIVRYITIDDITDYLKSFNFSGKIYQGDIDWNVFGGLKTF